MRALLLMLLLAARLAYAQEPARIPFENDHEFDGGSHITLDSLTPAQVENLAMLGKVWGFLKYHHPVVASGQRHWDYELLRVTPAVLATQDRAAASAVLLKWIADLGDIAPCNPCAALPQADLHLRPALEWLDDGALGAPLRAALKKVHANRPAAGSQFYISHAKPVGNPVFEHEPIYPDMKFPDPGFQLLALFRFWNIVEYWSPYRDVIGENWDDALRQSLPKVALARDRAGFEREMLAVTARVNDTHTNLWNTVQVRPPVGRCDLPVALRFIGNKAVVAGYTEDAAGKATGLRQGDIIEALDNVPISELTRTWAPYYAASNQPTRLRDMARGLSTGACGGAALRISRAGQEQELAAARTPILRLAKGRTHDRDGDTFQMLADDIAYIKLSSIKKDDIPRYLAAAAGTKGLVIDIRNYPSEFVVFALGQHLVDKPTGFASITAGDAANPGAFHWEKTVTLQPAKPHYAGKVMVLLDEISQSQAEYTAMAFRAAPRTKVVGSTTAGADGNVSSIPLPGGLRSSISGIGIFYPDRRPTQRVGIVPDIEVLPTVQGIQAGRDEVLEAAIAEIRRD
ncbi:S41 family peptidase [Massilia sp. Root418]|uniref:S41 family peptidase n=1 Tax=Massilia sp. Root418 TaxID=1736532 RepID=UPI0009ECAFDE|nr:S41 family peptidase [Massilia sp. Root418]